jgi:hypothetical protein
MEHGLDNRVVHGQGSVMMVRRGCCDELEAWFRFEVVFVAGLHGGVAAMDWVEFVVLKWWR